MLKKCDKNLYQISTFPLTFVHLKWVKRALPLTMKYANLGISSPSRFMIDTTFYDEKLMTGIRYLNYYYIVKRSALFI